MYLLPKRIVSKEGVRSFLRPALIPTLRLRVQQWPIDCISKERRLVPALSVRYATHITWLVSPLFAENIYDSQNLHIDMQELYLTRALTYILLLGVTVSSTSTWPLASKDTNSTSNNTV